MRQFFQMNPAHRKAVCFLAALAILTIMGPFGTYSDLSFFARLVFWTMVLICIGALVHYSVQLILSLQSLAKVSRAIRIILGAAIGAVPGVAVVAFVERVMRPPGMELDLAQLLTLWTQVALISMLVALVEYWLPQAEPEPQRADAKAPTGPVVTPFHSRLPRAESGPEDIVSLSMQDHYVEVVTDQGLHLVLMRLSDAIRELDRIRGLQIHRSHWVAHAHLRGLRTKGHRNWACLSDGRELSVSKTYLADVRAALDAPQDPAGHLAGVEA